MAFVQTDSIIAVTTPAGADVFMVESMTGEERMSAPFSFTLDMLCEDAAIDFTTIIGAATTVSIQLADGKHTLVLADDSAAATATPGLATVRYVGVVSDSTADEDLIATCVLEQQVVSGKYAVEDYAFTTPDTDILASQDSTAVTKKDTLRVYEYQTGHIDSSGGGAQPKTRLAALEA